MSEPGCHFVLQRVLECDYTNGAPRDAKYGNDSDTIGRGIIIHCAFLKGATSAHLKRAVDFIFDCSNFGVDNKNSIRKSEGAYGIMIIPQVHISSCIPSACIPNWATCNADICFCIDTATF